jgi:DNA-directed RNA polymerase beta' subunit
MYDGDTLAVHLMLSRESRKEYNMISVTSNLRSSIDWDTPNIKPSHEQIVGLYLATL